MDRGASAEGKESDQHHNGLRPRAASLAEFWARATSLGRVVGSAGSSRRRIPGPSLEETQKKLSGSDRSGIGAVRVVGVLDGMGISINGFGAECGCGLIDASPRLRGGGPTSLNTNIARAFSRAPVRAPHGPGPAARAIERLCLSFFFIHTNTPQKIQGAPQARSVLSYPTEASRPDSGS